MTDEERDTELLARMAWALRDDDPVPPEPRRAGQRVLRWRTIDDELTASPSWPTTPSSTTIWSVSAVAADCGCSRSRSTTSPSRSS